MRFCCLARGLIEEGCDREVQRIEGGGPFCEGAEHLPLAPGTENGMAISKIGEAIGVDRPRASRLTTELLDDGLIERRPDPDDSRYALIRLTPQGKALVNDMHSTRQAAVTEALSSFTPDESRIFADLLQRFVAAWPRQEHPPRE